MKANSPRNVFTGNLEHRGGKKLGQSGTEFFHKKHEVRRRPPRGFRGRKSV